MTFLAYVCQRLMGPPASGQSSWHCPHCDSPNPSFHVRPPKGNLPVKYTCFRCGAWGDEYDLARHFFARETFDARQERVAGWRRDYELATAEASTADGVISPGTGNAQPMGDAFLELDLRTTAMLLSEEAREHGISIEATKWVIALFALHCERIGVTPGELNEYVRRVKTQHAAKWN